MQVVKRNGTKQPVSFDKITSRIRKLCWGLHIDPTIVAQKVIQGVYNNVKTSELDELAAQEAFSMESTNLEFGILAARTAVSNLHKNTTKNIADLASNLYHHVAPNGEHAPLLSHEVFTIVQENADTLNALLDHNRDFEYDYFGVQTLCKSYLLRIDGKIAERPQCMLMRLAVELHRNDMECVAETYTLLAQRFYTAASPTLYNAGTPMPQLSSCFLLTMKDDSIDGIYDTLKQCAQISRCAGGIGLSIRNIRGRGSYIKGSNGTSDGIVKMLQVFGKTSTYVNQSGRRNGAFAIYLPPFHVDIMEFLSLKRNSGSEEVRARELFYALFIPDIFMKRVLDDGEWCLFCPNTNRELFNTHGAVFEKLYTEAEQTSTVRKRMKARDLWKEIIVSQIEIGGPFMLYADSCNAKSNQKHLGFIQQSNLCTEIIQYTSDSEIAVCNLSSIILPTYVKNRVFDFDQLIKVMHVVVRNLDITISRNYYPTPEAKLSNERHRPIGIGTQGEADVFMLMRFPFESKEAMDLNRDIFETMYFAACTASADLAEKFGAHESFPGSPMSEGKFQFDLWKVKPSARHNWEPLRAKIIKTGIRNMLLLCQMPTASTAHVNGTIESTEPLNSNIYMRRTQAGDFTWLNKHLVRDLVERKLWSVELKDEIIAQDGSIQNIDCIPDNLKALYKTVWEIKLKTQIDQSIQRAPFICQSQSLNFHMKNPTPSKLTAAHFYAWEAGLKTGMYYCRTNSASDAAKVTVNQSILKRVREDSSEHHDADGGIKKSRFGPTEVNTKRNAGNATQIETAGEICTLSEGCFSCGS